MSLAALLSKKAECAILGKSSHKSSFPSKIILTGDVTFDASPELLRLEDISTSEDTAYWICVKAYDLSILRQLKQLISKDSILILCSNGLNVFMDASDIIRRDFPLLRCLFSYGALKTDLDTIKISGQPRASLASLKGQEPICVQLASLLNDIGFEVVTHKDIATAEWHKAFINLLVNSLCCISNQPNKAVYESPGLRYLAKQFFEEIQAVTACEGFNFSELRFDQLLNSLRPFGENINNSLVDLRAGRKTDLDFLIGRFVRIAQEYDLEIPTAKSLQKLLKTIENNKLFLEPS
jgi:2-dehydropantoate 2-reductase